MASLTITVTIDDTDQKCLKNDLVNIDDWIQQSVSGKINNCWKRMQTEWTTKLTNDESYSDPIPSNKKDFVNLITGRSDYKNRSEQEAERNPE